MSERLIMTGALVGVLATVWGASAVRADAGTGERPVEVGNSSSPSTSASDRPFPRISLPGVDGVVVPPDLAQRLLGTNHGKWTYWLPSTATIEKFEADLPSMLKKNPPKARRMLWADLDHYKRQYVGMERRNGQRVLVTHLHCSVPDDWTNRIYIVFDGGPCHATIWFDLKRNRILNVFVNGYA
jgi:hypothetical protein